MSGVLVPLPNTSARRDTSELTLGEHKFALVHVRAAGSGGSGASSSAAVSGYLRSGGQVFPAIALPLDDGSGVGGPGAGAAASPHPDEEHEATDEERSAQAQHAAHHRAIVRPLVKQQSFQLYETSTRGAAAAQQQKATLPRAAAPQPSPIVSFIRSCQNLYSSLSTTLTTLPAQFVPFAAASATPGMTPAELLASKSVVRAMAVHPTLPQIALLVRDQVHCYDVYGGAAATTTAAAGAASTSAHTSAALASSLGLDRAALVAGCWVPRTLRHPLMARACSVAFAAPGGNLLAVGTELGVLCLWQLVSVPAAASGHAAATAAASGAASGVGSAGAAAGSARRMGAWLHVLHHPALEGLPLLHVSFSPCGRWLAVASCAAACFVIWDVSAALAGERNAGVPIQKLFGSLLEAQHGVDLLQWSATGDRLLVASHQRSKKITLALLASMGLRASKRLWQMATGSGGTGTKARGAKRTLHVDPEDDDASSASSPTAAAGRDDSLPAGTLTVWNTSTWSHQSWVTSAPLSSAAWALPSNPLQSQAAAAAAAPTLLLVALQGSSVIQSLHLPALASSSSFSGAASVSSSSSSLANASVRVDCRPVDGLPPSRQPSDPDSPLPRYLVGGAVRAMAWSAGGARLAVAFDEQPASGGKDAAASEGSPELVALFALNRDRTDTFQVLPVGMIRGPGCDCGGRVHRGDHSSEQQRATGLRAPKPLHASSGVRNNVHKKARTESGQGSDLQPDEDEMEHKYDEPVDSTESPVYPSLHEGVDSKESSVCVARNVPVHLGFLTTQSPAGELLVITWKFGQTTFVPMYFAK